MGRPDIHTFEVTHAELKLLLSGLGLEQDRWMRRARAQRTDKTRWPAVATALACEDLKAKLIIYEQRREKKHVGPTFTEYKAERVEATTITLSDV